MCSGRITDVGMTAWAECRGSKRAVAEVLAVTVILDWVVGDWAKGWQGGPH